MTASGIPARSATTCTSCFANRLPPDRFIPLMYHLLQCEDCDGFFDLLLKREAPTSQARLAQEWLDAAGRALEDAGCPGAEIITCQLTNVYAQAASGDDIVIEDNRAPAERR